MKRRLASSGAVLATALTGALILGSLGEVDNDASTWLMSRLAIAGGILAGLVLIVSALTALLRPQWAGWILLGSVPVSGFLLGYPSAGYLVWDERGGIFEQPLFPHALALSCVFYLPFALALVWRTHRKRARWGFLASASIAILVFALSHWGAALAPKLAICSLPLATPGAFWLWTDHRGWPPLVSLRSSSPLHRAGFVVLAGFSVILLPMAGTFARAVVGSSLFTADCSGGSLLLRPLSQRHVMVRVRIVWAGFGIRVAGQPVGDWAIAAIEERFWGLPSWMPNLVLLHNHMFQRGQMLLVSASRAWGILAQHLPILDCRACGNYQVQPQNFARIQLRLLRNPPAPGSGLLLGIFRSPVRRRPAPPRRPGISEWLQVYEWAFNSPPWEVAVTNARIRIASASKAAVVATDGDGYFEWDSGAPDDYTISVVDVPSEHETSDVKVPRAAFVSGFAAVPIEAAWSGHIEGRIEDRAGRPAPVELDLLNEDGSVFDTVMTGPARVRSDGNLDVPPLPPGRYRLRINHFGPWDGAPYPRMDYPRVLDLTRTNRIAGVRIVLNGLVKRTLNVRVRTRGGRTPVSCSVHMAYEHADYYNNLYTSVFSAAADQSGNAVLTVYGDARIRVQAFTDEENKRGSSETVELDSSRLPTRLDLTLPL